MLTQSTEKYQPILQAARQLEARRESLARREAELQAALRLMEAAQAKHQEEAEKEPLRREAEREVMRLTELSPIVATLDSRKQAADRLEKQERDASSRLADVMKQLEARRGERAAAQEELKASEHAVRELARARVAPARDGAVIAQRARVLATCRHAQHPAAEQREHGQHLVLRRRAIAGRTVLAVAPAGDASVVDEHAVVIVPASICTMPPRADGGVGVRCDVVVPSPSSPLLLNPQQL